MAGRRYSNVVFTPSDGPSYSLLVSSTPLSDHENQELGYVITLVDISERERLLAELAHERASLKELTDTLESQVQQRTQQVRTLASRLSLAEHRERERISQILHDHIQQMLYSVQMRIHLARLEMSDDNIADVDAHLDEMNRLAAEALRATRSLTVELSPPVLKSEGLPEALQWLAAHMKDLHKLEVQIESRGNVQIGDKDLRVLLFQLIRELLFNVVKHAGVDHAHVTLHGQAGRLVVTVKDQGKGFDASALDGQDDGSAGFGLASVQERLKLFNGSIQIQSAPGQGTEILLSLPTE